MKKVLLLVALTTFIATPALASNCGGNYSVCLNSCGKTLGKVSSMDFNNCVKSCEDNKTQCNDQDRKMKDLEERQRKLEQQQKQN